MAFNQKPSETGWFYHAPAKPKKGEAQAIPPPSQIPGLAGDHHNHPEEPQKRMWIRDTDSDYIRMAKQGGRADLLRFRSPKPKSDKPKGYPRVDWFYQDDCQAGEEQGDPDEQYEFMLPDYMVHQTIQDIRARKVLRGGNNKKPEIQKKKRTPYANDNQTVYDREGQQATNKTVKLPELRQPGYGVRAEKLEGKPVKHTNAKRADMIKPPEPELSNKERRPHMPAPAEVDPYCMGKILSYGYGRDWENQRDVWEDKQDKTRAANEKNNQFQQPKEKMQSEYQAKIESNATKRGSGKTGSRRESASELEGKRIQARKDKQEEERPEMFKLSKFKNVQAKTETHRHGSKAVSAGAN